MTWTNHSSSRTRNRRVARAVRCQTPHITQGPRNRCVSPSGRGAGTRSTTRSLSASSQRNHRLPPIRWNPKEEEE
ncbi:hypothetical protein K439DRAFT_1638695 [Ramaria rubella]|nr:hypothetical protein K439DRAFT_1638695 [Ramaria rubella]